MSIEHTVPPMIGIHNIRIPVTDLARSQDWYMATFGLAHEKDFIEDGVHTGVVLAHPVGRARIVLYLAPERVTAFAGFDPIAFEVADRAELDAWSDHLHRLGVEHKVYPGTLGSVVKGITDPDGIMTRLYTTDNS